MVALHGPPGSGLTRLGLSLLVESARHAPVVAVDVRGWMNPMVAWEMGIAPERFVVVQAEPSVWANAVGVLLDGVGAVYAELPGGVPASVLRRIAATARNRRSSLVLRPLQGTIPGGVAHLTVGVTDLHWEGVGRGRGRLDRRRLWVSASGKGVAGLTREIEVDDDGTHPLPLVERLAAASPRRAG